MQHETPHGHRFFSRPLMPINTIIRVMYLVLFSACTYLFLADQAFAWGPGVHMVTGNWMLQNLTVLPAGLGAALMQHPEQFLHGCLAPDFFLGKGSKPDPHHSHNWSAGFALLERARTQRGKAFALGYLAHLSADVVAHNVYVPQGFMKIFGSGRAAHVYLEVQADRLVSWDTKDALSVLTMTEGRWNSRSLQRMMEQQPLRFWMKRHIFRGSVALGGTWAWRSSFALLHRLYPFADKATIDYLLTISTRSIASALALGSDSPVTSLDPVGFAAIEKGVHKKQISRKEGKNAALNDVQRAGTAAHFAGAVCLSMGEGGNIATGRSRLLPDILANLPEPLADLPRVCRPS